MEELLTRKEAAEFLGLKLSRLNHIARIEKNVLPFIKVSRKETRYRLSDLEAYKEKLTANKKLLTRKEAAQFLGINLHGLNYLSWKKNNDLSYIRVDGVARYRLSDLVAFKEKLTKFKKEACLEKHARMDARMNEELANLEKRARLQKEACLEKYARINEKLANLNKEI